MLLCPEIQITIWETLKLVLSLFNDTFRQNPKGAIWNKILSIAICSTVISACVMRRLNISVNSSCLNHAAMPVKPSQTFVTKLPNKSRESCSVTFSFLLVLLKEPKMKALHVVFPLEVRPVLVTQPLYHCFSLFNSTNEMIFVLCCLTESPGFFVFVF